MKEEKFKILQFIREFIIRIEKELDNFPKKDIEIKRKIKSNTYELLELIYEANLSEQVSKKIDLLEKGLAKVKLIDFLINLSYDKELITQKKYIKLSEKLDDIVKYMSGLLSKIKNHQGIVDWLGSSYVNANDGYVNFGVRNVNSGNVGGNNLWRSYDGANSTSRGVRAVASKKLWLLLLRYSKRSFRQKQTISFSYVITYNYKIKIDRYICQQVILFEEEYILGLFLRQ